MRAYVALCVLAAIVYVALFGILEAETKKGPAVQALRLFISGLLAWLVIEIFAFLPISSGYELAHQRIGSLFWISATLLFLHFVYALLQRGRDLTLNLTTIVVGVATALFATTDLGMTAAVREAWGVRGIAGKGYWILVGIAAVPGAYGLHLLWRHFRLPENLAMLPAIRLIVFGGAFTLGLALAVNAVLPVALGVVGIPQIAPAAGSVFCVFVAVAMVRHDFLAITVERVSEELFERLPEGVALVNREGQVALVNQRAMDLLGLETRPASASDLPGYEIARASGSHQLSLEVEGEPMQLLLSVSPHRRGEEYLGDIVAYRDVSEEWRVERRIAEETEALEMEVERRSHAIEQARSRESLGAFAGTVIHDFNNQLFPIIGLCEIVLEQLPATDPRAIELREVLGAATKAADVGRKLLAFTRAEGSRRTLVDLVALVEGVAHFLRSSTPSGVTVEVHVEAAQVHVVGVAGALRQMLVNVAVNAVEALPPSGGTVSITMRRGTPSSTLSETLSKRPGGPIVLEVRDDGIGLPVGLHDEVLRPFFTTKGATGRAGLGLSVAQHIAAEHGGFIDIAPAPTQGTVVTIRFPGLLRQSLVDLLTLEPQLLGSERVLVAAASTEAENELQSILVPLGYRVFVMADALKAARVLRADPAHYDLLLVDGGAAVDVEDLIAAVHRHRPNLAVLVLATPEAQLDDLLGPVTKVERLSRPFIAGELARAVREVMDRSPRSHEPPPSGERGGANA